ncbi:MAG: phenylalanine--tRNA ligase subunit beta [Ruminococcaceae bacterium]|nr:phenylalanine--tRNA ligase subunit beta [Oscillospiraceae bacterium]
MKLSIKWLKDYVDINPDPKEYSEALTITGSKVEGFECVGDTIKNIVVGKILKIEKHPDADKLIVCQVDVGENEPVQIVTGANNVSEGDIIPVCKDGAVLPDGRKIKAGKLRGVVSNGMLCSLSELGLTKNDYPYAIEDGIFIMQEECSIGQDITEVLGLDDTVVEFEITSNRPDCLSVIGLARETAATYNLPLKLHTPVVKESDGKISDYIDVEVKEPTLCTRYCARVVKNVKIEPSPSWLRARLRSCGVRPINNIVDITNYVMLEYGQPMHAFDYECITGKKINVRCASNGEKMNTLDGVERTLQDSILVIADNERAIGLAGIMGGENSEIKDSTVTVVFESACFNAPCVRLGAKKVGLRTESSSRYEKGLDPNNALPALDRACELVNLLNAGEVVSGLIDINNSSSERNSFPLEAEWINKFLGIDISTEQMTQYLKNIDVEVKDGKVYVPTFRSDLQHKADIAEEIARFYGYDKIPSNVFSGKVLCGRLNERQKFEKDIINSFVANGLYEIATYSFISPKFYDKIGLDGEQIKKESVVILNPLGEDTSIMRRMMLPSMLETLTRNYNFRNESAALFELGKIYIPDEDSNKLPDERTTLCVGMYKNKMDFFDIKGVLQEIFDELNIVKVSYEAKSDISYYHPGRTAGIYVNGKYVGVVGQVHPFIAKNYGVEAELYCAEIDVEELYACERKKAVYTGLPKFPALTRDLALVCEDELPVAAIEAAIRKGANNILEEAQLFDVYKGKQIEQGKKSVAYSLVFRNKEKTLSDEEVDSAMKKIFKELEKIGAFLRS